MNIYNENFRFGSLGNCSPINFILHRFTELYYQTLYCDAPGSIDGNLSSSCRIAAISGTAGSDGCSVALLKILAGSSIGLWNGPALSGRGGGLEGGVVGVVPSHAPRGGLPMIAVAGLFESVVFGRRIVSVSHTGLKIM